MARARSCNSERFRCAGGDLYFLMGTKLEHSLQIRSSCGSAGWDFKTYTLEDLAFGGIWISEGLSPRAPLEIKQLWVDPTGYKETHRHATRGLRQYAGGANYTHTGQWHILIIPHRR